MRRAALCLDSASRLCCGRSLTPGARAFASSSSSSSKGNSSSGVVGKVLPSRKSSLPSEPTRISSLCRYSTSTTPTNNSLPTTRDSHQPSAELTFDIKGKGKERAPNYVYDSSLSYYRLLIPGTDIVSLARLQSYVEVYKSNQVAVLHLALWILSRGRLPRNDVLTSRRRWRALVYWPKRAVRGERIAPSLDVLCAEILKSEVERSHKNGGSVSSSSSSSSSAQVRALLVIAIKSFVGKAYRTLGAIGDLLASDEWRSHLDGDIHSREALLQLQGILVSHQSQLGWWDVVFEQKDKIVRIMQEQKEVKVLHEGSNSHLQMDMILLRSLLGYGAEGSNRYNEDEEGEDDRHTLGRDLASDESLVSEVQTLYRQMEEIYGQVSDVWLAELIKALALGIRIGISRHPFTVEDYNLRLPVWRMAMNYFDAHCQRHVDRDETPPEELLQPMLSLHLNLVHYCGQWERMPDQQGISLQSQEHRARISKINGWLADLKRQKDTLQQQHQQQQQQQDDDHHRQVRLSNNDNTMIHLDEIHDLERKARAVHTQTRLSLTENNWAGAIEALSELCHAVGPDEDFHQCVVLEEADVHDKTKIVARAMMQTRRLIRGTFIGILVHLDRCSDAEKRRSMPLLLPVLLDSIPRGLWDQWALWDANTRKRLKLLNYPALLVDPPAELAAFFARLLNMCCPVRSVQKNTAEEGFHVLNGASLLSTYWSGMQSYAEALKAVKKRSDFLQEKKLVSHHEDGGYYSTASSPDRALDRYLTQYGAGGASGIWAAFIDPNEMLDAVLSRLRLVLHDIYLPLRLNRSGWKAATIALQQVCPPPPTTMPAGDAAVADTDDAGATTKRRRSRSAHWSQMVWSVFEEARKKGYEQLEPRQIAHLDLEKRTAKARKNKEWRDEQKRKKAAKRGWAID